MIPSLHRANFRASKPLAPPPPPPVGMKKLCGALITRLSSLLVRVIHPNLAGCKVGVSNELIALWALWSQWQEAGMSHRAVDSCPGQSWLPFRRCPLLSIPQPCSDTDLRGLDAETQANMANSLEQCVAGLLTAPILPVESWEQPHSYPTDPITRGFLPPTRSFPSHTPYLRINFIFSGKDKN